LRPKPNVRRRSPSRGHNAGFLAFEAVVSYPFHPLVVQTVLVLGEHEHDGIRHLLIRQPTGGSYQIPDWMFDPIANDLAIVSIPRLPVSQLMLLRALIDRLVASPSKEGSTAKIIGTSSQIYIQFGTLVACLLGAKSPPVADMLQTMRGEAQVKALNALARHHLDALISIFHLTQQTRHNFAHHIWGTCPELPDALILVNPKHAVEWHTNIVLNEHGVKNLPVGLGLPRDEIKAYRESDLVKILDEMTELDLLFSTFSQHFIPHLQHIDVLGHLRANPKVQTALKEQTRQRRSSGERRRSGQPAPS